MLTVVEILYWLYAAILYAVSSFAVTLSLFILFCPDAATAMEIDNIRFKNIKYINIININRFYFKSK